MLRGARSVVFLLALCAPSVALAQSAEVTPVADEQSGRAAFTEGVALLNDSRFADAAAAFERSYRLNPVPVVLFNMAFAYRGLGRHLDAIATFERFIASPGTTPTERIDEGRAEVTRLRATLVTLTATVAPAEAQLLIDGRAQQTSTATLDPGAHVVEVTRDGFRPFRRAMRLEPGARESLDVRLEAVDDAARLRVEPTVDSAQVTIDGVLAGTGIVERPARAGVHRVVVSAEGFVTVRREVRVAGTGVVRVSAVLERPRTSPWPWLGPTIGVLTAGAIAGAVVGFVTAFQMPSTAPGTWDTIAQ